MVTSMLPLTLYSLVILNVSLREISAVRSARRLTLALAGNGHRRACGHRHDHLCRDGLSSLGAGLVFLGLVAPTFVASPLAGWVVQIVTAPRRPLWESRLQSLSTHSSSSEVPSPFSYSSWCSLDVPYRASSHPSPPISTL
ncbi:hypothetical protein BCR35DRAFT_37365 [Leucosporidium creatinivorum]|uniref:Uncharacterized protein n=1 Tax=Leucosporidium creatinivorum TaxID=106004 RepID=A0A1Y2FTW5_9BASI|nr:hypothetical protein BCR35DRAFT_37365 [Leucosporidium creatinivorum]